MRKLFSLIAAVLFAGAMMAQEVTIVAGDFTPATSSNYSVTKDGVTVAVTASTVTADQMRIFKNQSITISAETTISKIEFTCTANGAAQYGPGCFAAQDGYTFDAEGPTGTWTGSADSVTFVASTNQVRATQIVVTLEGGEPVVVDTYTVAGNDAAIFGTSWDVTNTANDMVKAAGIYKWEKAELNLTAGTIIAFKVAKNHSWDVAYPAQNDTVTIAENGDYTLMITFDPATEAVDAEAVKKVPLADPTNCAEAREAALSVSANNELYNNGAVYSIQGFVTEIAFAYDQAKGNMSFWMADSVDGGKVLEAYKCAIAAAADAPAVGDKVAVTGSLTKYNTTPEFAAGCTVTIIERAAVDTTEQEVVTITVAEAIAATMALADSTTSDSIYTVEGYVVDAQDFSWGSRQQIFFLADDSANSTNQVFEAYYCSAIENGQALPVLNGDKVQLTGKLTKFISNGNAIPEIKNGTATFVSKVDGDRSQPVAESITVAQALAYGAGIEPGQTGTTAYTIVGYVTAYEGKNADTDGGWAQYGNQIFWIADENNGAKSNAEGAFEIYQGVAPEMLNIGDKVSVYTKIKNYNGVLESETKVAVTILEKGDVTPVEDADVVFAMEDFAGQGTAETGSEITVEKDGVTFWCDKAYGDGQYGVRCYKGSNITITSAEQQIGKIVFEFGLEKTGGLDETIVVNGMEWSAENLASQARMNKVKIYFGEYEKPIVAGPDTVTVAQAVEIGMALADNATTDVEYVVKGWVVQAYAPNEGYTDQTWFMADEQGAYGEFEAYRCTPDYLVENDQFVYVKGKIQKYVKDEKVQIEIGKGTATHPFPQGIENVVLTEQVQKVVVDGVIYIIRDNKMFNLQGAQVR